MCSKFAPRKVSYVFTASFPHLLFKKDVTQFNILQTATGMQCDLLWILYVIKTTRADTSTVFSFPSAAQWQELKDVITDVEDTISIAD